MVLFAIDRNIGGNNVKQLRLNPDDDAQASDVEQVALRVREAWQGKFSYRAEDREAGTKGLRPPQLGALYATLAHWIESPEKPATIVMPTGTGKTETMLAVLVDKRLRCLLVVVPTGNLREQIAQKFITLGILKDQEVIAQKTPYPVVGKMEHRFATEDDADRFFRSCNVVVATMQVINTCSEGIRRKIAALCSHLIVDEATMSAPPVGIGSGSSSTASRSCNSPPRPSATTGSMSGAKLYFVTLSARPRQKAISRRSTSGPFSLSPITTRRLPKQPL